MGLGANEAHGFAAGHALVCYPTNAVYTFIPKNACSTMRVSLAMANGCIEGVEDWTWIHPNNRTFSASLRELVTANFTFVILRCPHARLASVFLDKIVSKTPEFWALYRLEGDQLDEHGLTFRQFVDAIARQESLRANIHWRPQEDFLVYEAYDAYYALEQFGSAVGEIERKSGMDITDARPLTRHGTDQVELVTDECHADTPLSALAEMKREGRAPAHACLYDAALAERVGALYQADIQIYAERFGTADLLFPTSLIARKE
ncbi:MAG: sulfotransferase family 2 domain-containing protein [Roseovarius sp.]